MDDISQKLADILNNPDSLNQIREMAENFLGESAKGEKPKPEQPDLNSSFGNDDFDPIQLGKIMSIMSQLKSHQDDNRAKLLLALKPHLSDPKQEKVDAAIKLLKLMDLLPLIKTFGLFDL